jgi:hypothetical protein
MHVLLSNKPLQTPLGKHAVRVIVSSVGATDSRVLVILDRIHRQSLDDLALVATLCLEPYSIDPGRTQPPSGLFHTTATYIDASSPA